MPNLLIPGVNGSPADVTSFNSNLDLTEGSFADLGPYLISGLAVTAGAGLAVSVALGIASIGGRVTVAAPITIAGLTPSTTNHLYLLQNGTGTANTTGTQPALSAKLGTCVVGVSTVTSVSQARSSGCQQQVRTESLVPGGPGGGNLGSINLAGWAAAAADSVTVYGVLPAGALPTNPYALSTLTDVTLTSTAQGDLLYRGSSAWNNLAAGTSGKFLQSQGASANPQWAAPTLASSLSDVVLTSAAQGDLLYRNSTQWVNLAHGTSGQALLTQGASANPAYAALNLAGGSSIVTGVLPAGNLPTSFSGDLTLAPSSFARNLISGTAGAIALGITAASGQTADLIYTQTSVGAGLFRVDANGQVVLADAINIAAGTSTGTKIGTGTTQKLGFWNATPVVKQTLAGVKSGGTALTNLISLLATLGILVDTTT
jgi:hypothetical protein